MFYTFYLENWYCYIVENKTHLIEINLLDFSRIKLYCFTIKFFIIKILDSALGFVFSRNQQCSYVYLFVFGRVKMWVSGVVSFRPKMKCTVSVGLYEPPSTHKKILFPQTSFDGRSNVWWVSWCHGDVSESVEAISVMEGHDVEVVPGNLSI